MCPRPIQEILEGEGIQLHLNAKCIGFSKRGERDCRPIGLRRRRRTKLRGTHVLLAVGRRPNTDDLGLDKAGVELDGRGYIRRRRSIAHQRPRHLGPGRLQWKGAFTHTSFNDAEIVAANLLDNDPEAGKRPYPSLRVVHRPAARPRGA